MSFGGKFEVRTLDDCVDWTSFLTIAAVYTLSHIDIISCGFATAVLSALRFDCDCLSEFFRLTLDYCEINSSVLIMK